jgi:transcriptional regulator with XRE-family HTH domain
VTMQTRRQAAWCPRCLSDQNLREMSTFRPFMWALSAVKCCPVHEIHLHSECPDCRSTFDHIDTTHFNGRCATSGCHGSFAVHPRSDAPGKWDLFCARAISELLEWSASKREAIPASQFCENLARAVATSGSMQRLASALGISRHRVSDWRRCCVQPRIEALCRFSYAVNVPISRLLDYKMTSSEFRFLRELPIDAPGIRCVEAGPTDTTILRCLHDSVVAKKEVSPSLASVARKLHMHSSSLLRRFPREARLVVQNHQISVKQAASTMADERRLLVQRAKSLILAKGGTASKRRVWAMLDPPRTISLRQVGYFLDQLKYVP